MDSGRRQFALVLGAQDGHRAGVHRWDAEDAFGVAAPLLDHAAECGLDEFGDMWLPSLKGVPTIRVDATDIDKTWTFGGEAPVETVADSASDLYLRLMSRPGAEFPSAWTTAVDDLAAPPKR